MRWLFYLEPTFTGGTVTKEEIISAIKECEARLGHVPSCAELQRAKVSKHSIQARFGTYTAALRACGMERSGAGHVVNDRALFLDWARLARKLGKTPSITEYELESQYSVRPLSRIYKSWKDVPAGMMEYAKKEKLDEEWNDVMNVTSAYVERKQGGGRTLVSTLGPTPKPRILTGEPIYGEPVQHPALNYAPTNESGVVFLFGVLAQELGFIVQRIQTEFPDCEAMRRLEPGKWQRVRIEFEYESRNFARHLHSAAGCDLIVCWRHNWLDCPLEVIELSREIGRSRVIG